MVFIELNPTNYFKMLKDLIKPKRFYVFVHANVIASFKEYI